MKVQIKEIATQLIGNLWESYLERVSYAKMYSRLVAKKGGRVVNDHIAFRTLNMHTGEQPGGIKAIGHIIECLEYKPVCKYEFPKKKLNAVHFEHPDNLLPKIFVSQLEVSKLPEWAQNLIRQEVRETPYLLPDRGIELLSRIATEKKLTTEAASSLIEDLGKYFKRPWSAPLKETVLKLNDISHYAAWVLLHGNSVSHFSALINYQDVEDWPDLETTCRGLRDFGIPMKNTIEGEKGSELRQSATNAVKEEAEVIGDDSVESIPWTYAYYGLVQRGIIERDGQQQLFSGFLGDQFRHLLDITNTLDN
jgi:hypothetical protein